MRIQKCYVGYCAVTWLLWIATLVLVPISGGAFDVHNKALYHFVNKLSNISVLISWLPIHPVLFILSLVSSIKNKRKGYTAFNIFSIILTTILAFCLGLATAFGQSSIDQLNAEIKRAEREIAKNEKLLKEVTKSKKTNQTEIKLLQVKINNRTKLIFATYI